MTTQSNTAVFKTVIATVVTAPAMNTTHGGTAVANFTVIDNRAEGGKLAYDVAAFGAGIALVGHFAQGDLVLIRGRYTETAWEKDGKSGVNRKLVAVKGTKLLNRRGERKQAA
jgi:single-stranded DNA-binding protein